MIEILVLGAVKALKIVALTVAAAATSLATQVAPATDWVAAAVTDRIVVVSPSSAGPRTLSRVPATYRSQRGAERATVFAISTTSSTASVIPVSVRCSTTSLSLTAIGACTRGRKI